MRVGIYGGTFDPPHLGHMRAARAALEALALDELILIPAKLPPHKELAPGSATAEDRLAMTELMADGLLDGRVSVSRIELDREGKSYTADTLGELRAQRPGDELFLLMGTDMYLSLQDWYRPEVIAELAVLCPFARSEGDSGALFRAQADRLAGELGARTEVVELPQVTELSSTQLRASLKEGMGADRLWLPVWGYILRHGLYGVERDLKHLSDDELRAASYSMVLARRLAHIRGCEEEAVRLARRWGADERDARRAGILHDCTKYLGLDEQLELCRRCAIPLDELERESEKLLHSKTGAAIAKYEFGENDAVYDAIFYHTTGRGDMTLLGKILYTADYMEPNRDFPEVGELRRLAYEDLDRAVVLGTELSIAEMKEKNRVVHPNTLACYRSLTGRDPGGSPSTQKEVHL